MSFRKLLFLVFIFPTVLGRTQNEVDALRYSFTDFAGSARSAGMSGAFSAAGADLSSLHGNPAGLAAYRRGAAELNLSFRDLSSTSLFQNQNALQTSNNFSILNAGIANVFNIPGKDNKRIVFGASYAKNNYFHEKNVITGNYNGSLLQSFVRQANGLTEDQLYTNQPFTAYPAYYTYLLDLEDTLNLQYRYNAELPASMQHSVNRSGSQSELSFAFALQPSESILVGLAIKMISVDFNEDYNHGERFVDTSDVSEFNFSYNLQSVGDAYSLSMGGIYIPFQQLRIGLSVETPALLILDEYFTTVTASNYLGVTYSKTSDELQSSSIIRMPGKIQAQISAILSDRIILNVDAERRSFQNSRIAGDGANTYDYASENEIIKTIYQPATKLSLGMEGRITQQFHLRGGLTWMESPFQKMPGVISKDILRFAMGGGYRTETWSVDAALQMQKNETQYFMYDPNLI
ncbi:MAG: hypothetical protein ACKOW8_03600, partial [Flavobacteriales bacterium]